jgi:hypothetical protein
VRCFAMLLVVLVTAGTPAVADVDPAVMAMLREWSLASPNPSSVVICHGFGCAFRTEIALTDADRAQMAAIMASGSPLHWGPSLPPGPIICPPLTRDKLRRASLRKAAFRSKADLPQEPQAPSHGSFLWKWK